MPSMACALPPFSRSRTHSRRYIHADLWKRNVSELVFAAIPPAEPEVVASIGAADKPTAPVV